MEVSRRKRGGREGRPIKPSLGIWGGGMGERGRGEAEAVIGDMGRGDGREGQKGGRSSHSVQNGSVLKHVS